VLPMAKPAFAPSSQCNRRSEQSTLSSADSEALRNRLQVFTLLVTRVLSSANLAQPVKLSAKRKGGIFLWRWAPCMKREMNRCLGLVHLTTVSHSMAQKRSKT
jgi:hypothetical protein